MALLFVRGFALSCPLVISGCASYWNNRYQDLRDCLSAYAGPAIVIPISLGVDATPLLPLGLGIASGPDGHAIGYGVHGRKSGAFKLAAVDLPFNFFLMNGYPDYPLPPAGSVYFDTPTRGWNRHRWGRLGAHFGLITFHAGAHIEFIEILDFLGGWTTLDIAADDLHLDSDESAAKPSDPAKA